MKFSLPWNLSSSFLFFHSLFGINLVWWEFLEQCHHYFFSWHSQLYKGLRPESAKDCRWSFYEICAFAITCCTSNPPSSVKKLPEKHSKIMPFDVWDAKRVDEPRIVHMCACMMEQYHRFCHFLTNKLDQVRFQLKLTPCDLKFSKENGLGAIYVKYCTYRRCDSGNNGLICLTWRQFLTHATTDTVFVTHYLMLLPFTYFGNTGRHFASGAKWVHDSSILANGSHTYVDEVCCSIHTVGNV